MLKNFFRITGLILLLFTGRISGQDLSAGLDIRLHDHVKYLASDSMEGRSLGSEGKKMAVDYIARQFREIGLKPWYKEGYGQEFDLRAGIVNIKAVNIAGFIPGSDSALKKEVIIIGAHYDHLGYTKKRDQKIIYHGADDNASGVATVIELGRLLMQHRLSLKRSVLFIAFDGEESGLLGSRKFTENDSTISRHQVKVMMSLDMVGMYSKNNGLDIKGIASLVNGKEIASNIAASRRFQIKETTSEIEAMTDTWYFGENQIPAIHAYTGLKSPYHKPEDTYDKLDYSGMVKITGFLKELITAFAGEPALIPSKSLLRSRKNLSFKFAAGVKVGLGASRHCYPEEYFTPKQLFSYDAGLLFQIHAGKNFTLQTSLLVVSDGSKVADSQAIAANVKSEGITFRRQSVSIPVNLHWNFVNQYGGFIKMYLFAGGYFLHAFSGKEGKENIDFDKIYNRNEWGVNAGAGMDIQKWQCQVGWQRSLTRLSQSKSAEIYPARWTLSVGYKFLR